jgi:hypothetical protein
VALTPVNPEGSGVSEYELNESEKLKIAPLRESGPKPRMFALEQVGGKFPEQVLPAELNKNAMGRAGLPE